MFISALSTRLNHISTSNDSCLHYTDNSSASQCDWFVILGPPIHMACSASTWHNDPQLERSVHAAIPSKALVHSGIFASHFFDINPDLQEFTELLVPKLFSSKFKNPISGTEERILVLGLTGSEDGKYRRRPTDFVFLIDKSGSMSTPLGQTPMAQTRSMGTALSGDDARPALDLTLDAAKGLFDLVDDDEEVGVLVFSGSVEELVPLRAKRAIDRGALFNRIDALTAGGTTNVELALRAAIKMIERSSNSRRNKRIVFLTDATPTEGRGVVFIRELSERAFVDSNDMIGITYIGIGLSFNAETTAELSRIHSSSVFAIGNWADLADLLTAEFNYLVSPIAFDIRITLSSLDYSISEVFGGDADCRKSAAVLSFRTITASSVRAAGVKGSVVVMHLTPRGVAQRSLVHITVEYTPFGERRPVFQQQDYLLSDGPTPVTEKAYALSVYYRTLQNLLPAPSVTKNQFNWTEQWNLANLRDFLKSQSESIVAHFHAEISTVDSLIENYCEVVLKYRSESEIPFRVRLLEISRLGARNLKF
jgi:hypothetical protein